MPLEDQDRDQLRVGVDLRCLQDAAGSGVSTYTRRMLQALAVEAPNINWSVFTSGILPPPNLSVILPSGTIFRHLRYPNKFLNLSMATVGWPTVGRCFPAARIIWQPNPLFLAPSLLPQFVTIHDVSFVHFPQFFLPHTRAWYLRWVKRWLEAAPANVRLLAVSAHTKDDVLTYFPIWQNRLTVIPPPPPLPPQHNAPVDLGRLYGIKRPFILSVGTIEPRKNIEALELAYRHFVRRYADYELVLVGSRRRSAGPNDHRSAVVGKSRVHYLGYVADDHREALYAAAFCFVYPSYYEGFGYPPLEAMSYGVPTIASAVSSLPEVLGSAVILIDPYRAVEEIAAALMVLADDSAVYRYYQEAGRRHIETLRRRFSSTPLVELWRASVSV